MLMQVQFQEVATLWSVHIVYTIVAYPGRALGFGVADPE